MDIKEIYLKDIDINDYFFNSLKNDYPDFEKWFIRKQKENRKAFVTYKNKKLSSFLLLKVEQKTEKYPFYFSKKKRLKVSTFKVEDINKGIATKFIEIINQKAEEYDIDEIYMTVFPKYKDFINFLEKNNFNFYMGHNQEYIYVKKIKRTIILPIKAIYVEKILTQEKKYEYRKQKPKKAIDKIIIYATSPIKKIVGEVEVKQIIEEEKEKLWQQTKNYSGIDKKFYDEYFKKNKKAIAYELGKIKKYEKDLIDFGINFIPQSYVYL